MPMYKWDPFQELVRLRSMFNELFERTFERQLLDNGIAPDRWAPAVDVFEDNGVVVVQAEVPGVARQDINIEYRANQLTIHGHRKASFREGEAAFHRVERDSGPFRREIPIPMDINEKGIQANYDQGVLTVTLPMVRGEEAVKSIPIKPKG